MRIQQIEVRIASPACRVWDVMKDVERWPEWTPSIREVVPLGPAPLAVGRHFRIIQPRLEPMVWTVTQLRPGRSFSWQTPKPGIVLTARHEIEAEDTGSRVRLCLEFEGMLGGAAAWLLRSIDRRYLRMEADGLKARCERSSDDLLRPAVVEAQRDE